MRFALPRALMTYAPAVVNPTQYLVARLRALSPALDGPAAGAGAEITASPFAPVAPLDAAP